MCERVCVLLCCVFNNLVAYSIVCLYYNLCVDIFSFCIVKTSMRRHVASEHENWIIDLTTAAIARDFDTMTWHELENLIKNDRYWAGE